LNPSRPIPSLVLVGGGHAHLHVLASLAAGAWPPVRVTLVSPRSAQLYSGMVPGYIQGAYPLPSLTIDLPGLCRAAGVGFVEDVVERVEVGERRVRTRDRTIPFSILSLDIGSVPAGADLPGVGEHATPLRPLRAAVRLRDRLDALASAEATGGEPARIVVVGAGAGGVEVALAAHRRVRRERSSASVLLLERGDRILPDHSLRGARRAAAILESRGIRTLPGHEVVEVDAGGVRLADGKRLPADCVVWVGGAAAPPLLGRSDLPLGEGGYLRVDRTLQVTGGLPIWGAGDCIDFDGYALPKAGVFAVRQGPILAHNLRAALSGESPRLYRPQPAFLSILNTADGKGLLHWRGMVNYSRAAWWLKDHIDRRFVGRYRRLAANLTTHG